MKIKFSVDRTDENNYVTVCFDVDGNKYEFPADRIGLEAGTLFYAILGEDGLPSQIQPLPEETAEKRRQLHNRTSALFQRNKIN